MLSESTIDHAQPSDTTTEQHIQLIEPLARVLEPNTKDRNHMTNDVMHFGNMYLTELEHPDAAKRLPGWQPFDEKTVFQDSVAIQFPETGCFLHHAADTNNNKTVDGADVDRVPATLDEASWNELLDVVKKDVIAPAMNPSSPCMFGYVPGGGVYPCSLADYISAITNRFSGMFCSSPGAVKMENMIIRWAAEVMGVVGDDGDSDDDADECDRATKEARLRRVGGCLTSGASIATASAFVCAREHHKILAGGESGDIPPTKFVVYNTDQVHGCVGKALGLIGAGHTTKRIVPRDHNLRMIPSALKHMIEEDIAAGLVPWLVVMSAGTTNSGAMDPLEDIAEIGKKHKMWVHCDGAYGGLYALCPEVEAKMCGKNGATPARNRCRGLRLADSVVADPHKGLFLPYGTGMLLVKKGQLLVNTHSISAHYLTRFVDAGDEVSSADTSMELSKHFRALRMWLPLRVFGIAPFRASQSEKIHLAQYFYSKINKLVVAGGAAHFAFFCQPQLAISMYRLVVHAIEEEDVEAANVINQRLTALVLEDKDIFISNTKVDGVEWLRLAIGVFRSHKEHVDHAIDRLVAMSCKVVSETTTSSSSSPPSAAAGGGSLI